MNDYKFLKLKKLLDIIKTKLNTYFLCDSLCLLCAPLCKKKLKTVTELHREITGGNL